MTKTDIIAVISERTQIPKNTVSIIVSEMNSIIIESLKKGEAVKIAGFGIFAAIKKGPRKGRNPKTGETIEIPAKTFAKFKAGKEFKSAVNN